LAIERIDRLGRRVSAAVMTDIGDPAVALMVDGRLIGGPTLKIAKPDKAHIVEFWWVTNFLRLSDNRPARRQKD
jgi:hypothetical protein